MVSSKNNFYDLDKSFKTAHDLLRFLITDNYFDPIHIFDVSEKLTNGYIFRGQGQKDWPLLPTVHRDFNGIESYTPQLPDIENKANYIRTHTHAEIRAVYLFLQAADHVGLKTPINYSLFKSPIGDSDELFDLELLPSIALAQHHGVPTRLLDWTESPFIAAYFAAKSALSIMDDSEFSIICISNYLLKDIKSIDLVSVPKFGNDFLRAQKGLFTIINSANLFFNNNGEWPSMERIIADEIPSKQYFKQCLIRLSLPHHEAMYWSSPSGHF